MGIISEHLKYIGDGIIFIIAGALNFIFLPQRDPLASRCVGLFFILGGIVIFCEGLGLM